MNKRILTLVLALVMVFSLAVGAFAAPAEADNAKVQWLVEKGIIEGRLQDDGKTKDLELDKTITREEVAKIVIYYRGSESLARALQGTKGIFTDVNADRWSNGFINAAQVEKLVEGYPDKTFQPAGDITYAEMAAILVRMNKKWTAADEKDAKWPLSYIEAAESYGILKGLNIKDFNEKAVREKVFEMMYNAFDGKYQAPVANDRLGVVSRVWANEIELNGKVTYTLDKNTVVVNKNRFNTSEINGLYGELVRVVVNADNEVSHIVRLSNTKVVNRDVNFWTGIAEQGAVKGEVNAVDNTTIANPSNKGFKAAGQDFVVDSNTRIFVADKDNGNFFETDKLDKAIDFKKATHLQGVYFVYDTTKVQKTNYVRAIVFSSGKEDAGDGVNYRVVDQIVKDFKLTIEDVFAKEKVVDFAKYRKAFPYNYGLDYKDVAEFVLDEDGNVKSVGTKWIDYSEDDVFKVENREDFLKIKDGKVSFIPKYIKLTDKGGKYAEFDMDPKADIFTHTAISKNNPFHVQIHINKDTGKVDVVSIVDIPLRGKLENGIVDRNVCFTVADDPTTFTLVADAHYYYITIEDEQYYVDAQYVDDATDKLDMTKIPGYVAGMENVEICGVAKASASNTNIKALLTNLAVSDDYLADYKACEAKKAPAEKAVNDFASVTVLDATNIEKAKAALAEAEAYNKCAANFGLGEITVDDLKDKVTKYENVAKANEAVEKLATLDLHHGGLTMTDANAATIIQEALGKGYVVTATATAGTGDEWNVNVSALTYNGEAATGPVNEDIIIAK